MRPDAAGRGAARRRPRAGAASRAARAWCCGQAARSRRSTRAAARSASTCCRRFEQGTARRADARRRRARRWRPTRAERFFAALGKHVAWVGDAPGLVLGRIVCQVINECGVRARRRRRRGATDIDTGMVLGLSHPRGPLGVGRRDRARPRADGARARCTRSTARSATARRRRCARLVRRAARPRQRARASSSTTARPERTSRSRPPATAFKRVRERDEHRGRPLPALPRRAPRRRVALPRRRRSAGARRRTASRRRSSPRCAPTRPAAPASSNLRAWVLTIAQPQGARRPPGARAARAVPVAEPGGRRRPAPAPRSRRRATRSCGRRSRALPERQRSAVVLRFVGDLAAPRDRGGDRLLGGGRPALAARGPDEAEKGGAGMSGESSTETRIERCARSNVARRRPTAPGAARRRTTRRRGSPNGRRRGAADVAYAHARLPVRAAARREHAARRACAWRFPEESEDAVLERLASRLSPRILRGAGATGSARRRARRVLRGPPARVRHRARLVADRAVRPPRAVGDRGDPLRRRAQLRAGRRRGGQPAWLARDGQRARRRTRSRS